MPGSLYRHLGVWREGDVTVVRFGDHHILDEMTVGKLGDELYGIATRPDCAKLLISFVGVEHLTSLMLGRLLMLKRRMEAKPGRFMLCEMEPVVYEIFTTTHLHEILEIHESLGEALAAMAKEVDHAQS